MSFKAWIEKLSTVELSVLLVAASAPAAYFAIVCKTCWGTYATALQAVGILHSFTAPLMWATLALLIPATLMAVFMGCVTYYAGAECRRRVFEL